MEPSRAGGKLTLERWLSGSVTVREADLPGLDAAASSPSSTSPSSTSPSSGSQPAASQWMAAPDLSLVVWVAGNTLDWEAIPLPDEVSGPSRIAVPLPRERNVLALGILPDHSVAAALSDGSVERWDSSDGAVLERWRSRLAAADQAVVTGDYLALSSAQAGRLLLYRFRNSSRDPNNWNLQEEAVAPDPPYTLAVPAPGVMAQLTPAGLRMDGQTRSAPGDLQICHGAPARRHRHGRFRRRNGFAVQTGTRTSWRRRLRVPWSPWTAPTWRSADRAEPFSSMWLRKGGSRKAGARFPLPAWRSWLLRESSPWRLSAT